jgi:hypothetical protein
MKQYRITKYNPTYRNNEGHYTIDEWTSISDIGKSYDGNVFSLSQYIDVEKKYIEAITLLMICNNVDSFVISGLEKCSDESDRQSMYKNIQEGDSIEISEIPHISKLILREKMWCRLEAPFMFVHFGYDYYMYIGFTQECKYAIDKIVEMVLFVEEYKSPYLDENWLDWNIEELER